MFVIHCMSRPKKKIYSTQLGSRFVGGIVSFLEGAEGFIPQIWLE